MMLENRTPIAIFLGADYCGVRSNFLWKKVIFFPPGLPTGKRGFFAA